MNRFLRKNGLLLLALLIALLAYPPQWYPYSVRLKLTAWFGASDYRPLPASTDSATLTPEIYCPPDVADWRAAQTIDGVDLEASRPCVADNPYAVAAFVRGTNNVSR